MKELKPMSPEAQAFKYGTYKHYKGKIYEAIAVARHSETLEEMVVYQAAYGENEVWVRPLAMFLDKVVVNEKDVPRFEYLEK